MEIEQVKIPRSKKGKSTIKTGKEIFDENGKLKVPVQKKTATEQLAELKKKDPSKARTINKIADAAEANQKKLKAKVETPEVPLQPVPEDVQKIVDVECIKVQPQRDSLIQLVRELQKVEGLTFNTTKDGCLSIFSGTRRLAKLIPYKRLWSFEKNDGRTVRPTVQETMKVIQVEMEAVKTTYPATK